MKTTVVVRTTSDYVNFKVKWSNGKYQVSLSCNLLRDDVERRVLSTGLSVVTGNVFLTDISGPFVGFCLSLMRCCLSGAASGSGALVARERESFVGWAMIARLTTGVRTTGAECSTAATRSAAAATAAICSIAAGSLGYSSEDPSQVVGSLRNQKTRRCQLQVYLHPVAAR